MKKLLLLSSVMALPAFGMEKQAFQDGVGEGKLQAMEEMRRELMEEVAENAIISQKIEECYIIRFAPKKKPFPKRAYFLLNTLFNLLLKNLDRDGAPYKGEWSFNPVTQNGELDIYAAKPLKDFTLERPTPYRNLTPIEWLEKKVTFLKFKNGEELDFEELFLMAEEHEEDENQKKQQGVVERSESLEKEIKELIKEREKKEEEFKKFEEEIRKNWK